MTQSSKKRSTPERKPYKAPTLSRFGTVAELTRQGGNGPSSDAGMNQMGS